MDLHALPDLGVLADGIWCSFTTVYFPYLSSYLAGWARHLRPGGWIALTEIDNLFGHERAGFCVAEHVDAAQSGATLTRS